jgi:DNA-binding response OmpR family regulator
MASILLSEADPDVRRLLVVLLGRLGHDTIALDGGIVPPPADLMLLEPASPSCLAQAAVVREEQPELPVICVSILPSETCFLGHGPRMYLAKPFTIDELDAAVNAALEASAVAA